MSGKSAGKCPSRPGASAAVDLLRSRHRRQIVRGIGRGGVDREADLVFRGGDADEVESALRETHLPLLEEAGIVEWDRETGRVSKGPNFDEAERLLDALEGRADEASPSEP